MDRVTQQQVLDRIEQLIDGYHANRRQTSCQQLITVNPEFVMAAQGDSFFRQCINEAALVIPDGIGVVWATRYLGKPVPERVTGVDTLVELARRSTIKGYRLYLLGAAPGVAEAAGRRLQTLVPGLQIAGSYAGSPAIAEEDEIIEQIRVAQADILCVAYGAPAQDVWIRRNLGRLPVAIAMGIGGSFDFLTGRRHRAPKLMQKLGLEWLYRLSREPWRWRRMLALPKFAIKVAAKGFKAYGTCG